MAHYKPSLNLYVMDYRELWKFRLNFFSYRFKCSTYRYLIMDLKINRIFPRKYRIPLNIIK